MKRLNQAVHTDDHDHDHDDSDDHNDYHMRKMMMMMIMMRIRATQPGCDNVKVVLIMVVVIVVIAMVVMIMMVMVIMTIMMKLTITMMTNSGRDATQIEILLDRCKILFSPSSPSKSQTLSPPLHLLPSCYPAF